MKCQYCNQELNEIGRGTFNGIKDTHFKCKHCDAYFYYRDNKIIEITMSFTIKEKSYWYVIQTVNRRSYISHIKKNDDATLNFHETICQFNFIPNWTPQNVKQKVEAYLVFI